MSPPTPSGTVRGIPAATLALAEDTNAIGSVPVGCERLVEPGYVIWLSPRPGAVFTVVQRLRLDEQGVERTVDEIRGRLRERRRTAATWEVGTSATPPDLVERLTAMGMRPFEEPLAVGMVLTGPPQGPPGDGRARRVQSLDEYATARRIQATAFGSGGEPSDGLLDLEWAQERDGADRVTYLAFVDGAPAAAASSKFTDAGTVLNGAGTLPEYRGRGAFRALIAARWRDAVDRGAPALIVQAGAMSFPILQRCGFVETCRIQILLDEVSAA